MEAILNNPELFSAAGVAIVLIFTLGKYGVWQGIGDYFKAKADKMSSNGNRTNARLNDLEDFKVAAEGNHFTDLDALIKEVHELRKKVSENDNRLVRLETKIEQRL